MCGGYDAFSLYRTNSTFEPRNPSYLGCFADDKDNRVFTDKYSSDDMTPAVRIFAIPEDLITTYVSSLLRESGGFVLFEFHIHTRYNKNVASTAKTHVFSSGSIYSIVNSWE